MGKTSQRKGRSGEFELSRILNNAGIPTSPGTALNYEVLEEAVSRVRSCPAAAMGQTFAGGAWKARIDKDYAKRSKNRK